MAGNLVGYNSLPQKELFRYFGRIKATTAASELIQQSDKISVVLHQLLSTCCDALLCKHIGVQLQQVLTGAVKKDTQEEPELDPCPLDYFWYPNDSSIENCSAHVDRGLMHAVVVSDTAGLQVMSSAESSGWLSVDSSIGLVPFHDVIVFPNQMMEQLTTCYADAPVQACTHRVVGAGEARLSISFELRAQTQIQSVQSLFTSDVIRRAKLERQESIASSSNGGEAEPQDDVGREGFPN